MSGPLRIGVVAPKNSWADLEPVLDLLDASVQPYRRGGEYDVVWFFNLTPEVRLVRRHTGAKVFGLAVEPPGRWPHNYDPALLEACDLYMGYEDFAGPGFRGEFQRFVYPAATAAEVEERFEASCQAERRFDFCIFARHDPNLRAAIGRALRGQRAILAGPLFGNETDDKLTLQRRCRYEFVTENEINGFYFSEKLGQALLAGCVPVYYGCTRIKEQVPEGLFVDIADFVDGDPAAALPAVIEHCLTPGVWEGYAARVHAAGGAFLLRHSTWEANLVTPLQRYLGALADQGLPARRASWVWRACGLMGARGAARRERLVPAAGRGRFLAGRRETTPQLRSRHAR